MHNKAIFNNFGRKIVIFSRNPGNYVVYMNEWKAILGRSMGELYLMFLIAISDKILSLKIPHSQCGYILKYEKWDQKRSGGWGEGGGEGQFVGIFRFSHHFYVGNIRMDILMCTVLD